MKESRVFELNQVTAEQVLEAVTTFLRGEKGMEVQSVATPNGYLIQAAQADTLRTLSGMKLATTVELTVNGTQLNVTLGEGQWADKLGAGDAVPFPADEKARPPFPSFSERRGNNAGFPAKM